MREPAWCKLTCLRRLSDLQWRILSGRDAADLGRCGRNWRVCSAVRASGAGRRYRNRILSATWSGGNCAEP